MRKSAEPLTPAFSVIPFDLENAPKLERKADPPKEKKKAPKAEAAPAQAAASSSAAPAPEKKSKKADKAPVGPLVLGVLIFVVIGSGELLSPPISSSHNV